MHLVILLISSFFLLQGCSFSSVHCGSATQTGFQMKLKDNFDPDTPVSGKKVDLKKILHNDETIQGFITSLGVVVYCSSNFN